nr:alpha-1,6-mannosyl-glycoprotein 4-beta-N-acetylglucosaminyltransferase-like [Lytechinus pictus]
MRRNRLFCGTSILVIGVIAVNLLFVLQLFKIQDSRMDMMEATFIRERNARDETSMTQQRPGSDPTVRHSTVRDTTVKDPAVGGPTVNNNDRNNNVTIPTNHDDEIPNLSHKVRTAQSWAKPSEKVLEQALVLGSRRKSSGFLTIGIPTVQRETEHYLSQTLDSLISKSSPKERSDVVIVILLADFEEKKRSNLKKMIQEKYSSYLENGFIQVIQVPLPFYPPLENLKSNYKDSETRVYWRSKQCVDFAFMFFYGSSLSEYYLQIEDDVYTVNGYLAAIRAFIEEKSNIQWASGILYHRFIGKLFHAL